MWHVLDRIASKAAKLPLIGSLVPKSLRGKLRPYLYARSMRRLPDRRYMEAAILPGLSALGPVRVLFVGVELYTRHYEKWFAKAGAEYWTLDVRPEVARHGAKGRHMTGSVTEADALFAGTCFDQVFLNGVFGWGVDGREAQGKTIASLRSIMKPGAVLLLGWNDNRVPEPLELAEIDAGFVHSSVAGLPARKTFEGSSHVYDFFVAK